MIHARFYKREAAFFNHPPGTVVVLSFFLIFLFGCSEKAPSLSSPEYLKNGRAFPYLIVRRPTDDRERGRPAHRYACAAPPRISMACSSWNWLV